MVVGLRHINLNVADLDRSVHFYATCFELTEIERVRDDAAQRHGRLQRLIQAFLSSARSRDLLALSQWEHATITPGGLDHLGFILDSDAELAPILERVAAAGGTIGKRGTRESHGHSEAFAYVQDPDGYHIELATQAGAYALLGASAGHGV